jgi:ElaB/YqjD/DUF883 family membrane-anchored ribosome-binding protein
MEIRSKKEIAREIEATRRQFDRVLKDTASVLPGRRRVPTWNVTKETCQMIQRRVAGGTHALQEHLAGGAQRMQERVLAGAHQADEVVHKKPYPFLAIALGIGALLAFLATPRSRRRRLSR